MILHASIVDIPLFGYKYDIYSEDDEPMAIEVVA
jgi:hypothetical protein